MPQKDEKWRAVHLRWMIVRDNENEIKKACAAFWDNYWAGLEGAK